MLQDFSVEPVGRLLPQLLSSRGSVLLADPTDRTRHNRCALLFLALSQRSLAQTIHRYVDVPWVLAGYKT